MAQERCPAKPISSFLPHIDERCFQLPTRSRPNSWTGLKNKKRQPKRPRVGDLVTTDYGFPNCNRLRLTRNLHKRSSSKPPTSMRRLASQLTTYCTCTRRSLPRNFQSRNFSSYSGKDELSLEQDAERKIGWLFKLIFVGTSTIVAYQFLPYMDDNLMQQSVKLLHVNDPLFKRMGASRLASFAIDDERRMKIVEMGGAQELVNMLGAAKDDHTRKEALKALSAISQSDDAVGALHHAGAISVINSTPDNLNDAEVEKYKSSLLKRFREFRYDTS